MLGLLTGSGFAAAAGLNAFLPLVVIAVLARFNGLIELAPGFTWLSSWPALLVLLALLLVEAIIDKVPGVDHVNDLLQTPVRPTAGALAFAAVVTADIGGTSAWWNHHLWFAWILGVIVAFAVHLSKAASRTALSAATGGAGSLAASFAEDGIAFTLCLFALFVPWLVVPSLFLIAAGVYWIVTIGRRRRQRKAEKQRRWRAEREAADLAEGIRGWLERPRKRLLARTPVWAGGTRVKAPGTRPRRSHRD